MTFASAWCAPTSTASGSAQWRRGSGVSVSSVPKWTARYLATGSVAPGRVGDHRPWLLEPRCERVYALVARERAQWRTLRRQLDPDRLVFVDETFFKTNTVPMHVECHRLKTFGRKRRREGGDVHRAAKTRRTRLSRGEVPPRSRQSLTHSHLAKSPDGSFYLRDGTERKMR